MEKKGKNEKIMCHWFTHVKLITNVQNMMKVLDLSH